MNPPPPSTTSPLRFALEGEGIRRAASAFERERVRLTTALRRALPFLAKRDVPIELGWTTAMPMSELLRDMAKPFYVLPLQVNPGDSPGALLLDGGALGMVLDGVLGGDGRSLPMLNPDGLTAPQTALVSRSAEGLLAVLGEVLSTRLGVKLSAVRETPNAIESDGTPLVTAFMIDNGMGMIVLVLPQCAMAVGESPKAAAKRDERVEGALQNVDLELVVELARMPMRLEQVMSLKVGDTIPLDVLVGSSVCVRTDNRLLFMARPTNAGGRIAVRIEQQA